MYITTLMLLQNKTKEDNIHCFNIDMFALTFGSKWK